jgi:hypothetical protein
MRKGLLLLVSALGAAACATEAEYVYRPAEQATALLGGQPAARYAIPPESPRGTLRVASCGAAAVDTTSGRVQTLHVRLAIANNNDTGPWEVDTDALRVAYASGDVLAPLFVNASAPAAPTLRVAPGEAATIDAYFPLPLSARSTGSVPRFDLLTKVQTPSREVVERTPFERIRIEPTAAVSTSSTVGLWPVWWYDPAYFPVVLYREQPRVYFVPRR